MLSFLASFDPSVWLGELTGTNRKEKASTNQRAMGDLHGKTTTTTQEHLISRCSSTFCGLVGIRLDASGGCSALFVGHGKDTVPTLGWLFEEIFLAALPVRPRRAVVWPLVQNLLKRLLRRLPLPLAGARASPLEKFDSRTNRFRRAVQDRKSTRLNSSHVEISYAVFCLKKKKEKDIDYQH